MSSVSIEDMFFVLFFFAAIVGSVLNVCVARLPFRRRPGESSIPIGLSPSDPLERRDQCG